MFTNGLLPDKTIQTYGKGIPGLPGIGFKLTVAGDYDMQNKKLVNVDEGENNQDVVNKHQLDVGLQTKPNKTDVLLLDGTTHMVGDLDLRGNKIILPGEIQMDQKLITNLDTDENQDLSAVNMITLKNKVEPKADKNYVDFEITKQNALINNTFVKKTGDQMNGDLILPHDSYPVGGNTNKAISYESQREIFLSRQESFPMQADINMNNNFIQNIATPTSSHQVTNKGYCDYNFLNRQSGGVLMGPLSMNQNDLFEIPAPKYGNSAANKNYVDTEITKVHQNLDLTPFLRKDGQRAMTGSLNMNGNQIIRLKEPVSSSDASTKGYTDQKIDNIQKINTTLFIKKDGSVPMAADLDMDTHKISNVVNPEFDTDVVNKQYLENKLIESHLQPSGPSNIFHFLMNDTSKFSSIREIIIGSFSDVEKVAHRLNKKALSIFLQNDLQTVSYSARLGLDMTSLSVGDYTLVMEFYWPEKFNIYTYADSTPTNIVDEQNIKNFSNYQKLYLQFTKKNTISPNNLIMEIRGELSSSNQQTGYLIFYGTKGTHYSITNDFYDQYIMSDIFIYNENMKMQTKIDMNNNKIIKLSNGTDPDDAVNKGQLDSVSVHTNNQTYREIFNEFYDLVETSRFNVNTNSNGLVILGVKPNLFFQSNRLITNYDRSSGIQLSNSYINLGDDVDQNSSYTIFISLYFSEDIKIQFSDINHNIFYPSFSITYNNSRLRINRSLYLHHHIIIPADFKNKQVMLWVCHNAPNNLYRFAISNHTSFIQSITSPASFKTKILRIIYNNHVKKIGWVKKFININSLDHHRIMLEELREGSFFR